MTTGSPFCVYLFPAVASNMGRARLSKGSTVRTLRNGTTLIRRFSMHSNFTRRGKLTFLLMCCRGLSVCWQLLTLWPRTHASQAYFSPLINMILCFGGVVARRKLDAFRSTRSTKQDDTGLRGRKFGCLQSQVYCGVENRVVKGAVLSITKICSKYENVQPWVYAIARGMNMI